MLAVKIRKREVRDYIAKKLAGIANQNINHAVFSFIELVKPETLNMIKILKPENHVAGLQALEYIHL